MTFGAVLLGFLLPYLDSRLGPDWICAVGLIRPTEVDGARAILTTLAGATLGVAGVAFSVTIVAVSFASSNYGPRLIGNFMGDRKNQIVLGIFVATFVYCITVLSTVHGPSDREADLDAFVPQLTVFFALLLTLAAVGALIAYIHHIPEFINIMNLDAKIGDTLHRSIVVMLDEVDRRRGDERDTVDVEAWRDAPKGRSRGDLLPGGGRASSTCRSREPFCPRARRGHPDHSTPGSRRLPRGRRVHHLSIGLQKWV